MDATVLIFLCSQKFIYQISPGLIQAVNQAASTTAASNINPV